MPAKSNTGLVLPDRLGCMSEVHGLNTIASTGIAPGGVAPLHKPPRRWCAASHRGCETERPTAPRAQPAGQERAGARIGPTIRAFHTRAAHVTHSLPPGAKSNTDQFGRAQILARAHHSRPLGRSVGHGWLAATADVRKARGITTPVMPAARGIQSANSASDCGCSPVHGLWKLSRSP